MYLGVEIAAYVLKTVKASFNFLLMIRSMDLIMDYLTVSKRIEGKYLNNILLFMLVRLLV